MWLLVEYNVEREATMTTPTVITKLHIIRWLEGTRDILHDNSQYLTDLDAAIGDADHGINISRGFQEAVKGLPTVTNTDIGNILKTFGMALLSSIGGASGPLYGTFFIKAGMAVTAKEELTTEDIAVMVAEGMQGILSRGRAAVGDKTMIDTWHPAVGALADSAEAGDNIITALTIAVDAGRSGMESTVPLQARRGRASYLGERSIGHQDPGATSAYLILNQLLLTLNTDS